MNAEKLKIKIYKNQYLADSGSMMLNDLMGILTQMPNKEDTVIVLIENYNGTQEEKEEALKEVLDWCKEQENVVILTWAYVSTLEFPPNKFYDPHDYKTEVEAAIKAGRKPIPFDEVIKRESELLESVGFVDFNFFVNYEFSNAYLYPNKLGKEVIEKAKKLQEEFRHKYEG